MKCQIPGCNNESVNIISKDGIYFGFSISNNKIAICGNHEENEIENCIDNVCKRISLDSQMINPFSGVELLEKNHK
jgi:hypothetical protein